MPYTIHHSTTRTLMACHEIVFLHTLGTVKLYLLEEKKRKIKIHCKNDIFALMHKSLFLISLVFLFLLKKIFSVSFSHFFFLWIYNSVETIMSRYYKHVCQYRIYLLTSLNEWNKNSRLHSKTIQKFNFYWPDHQKNKM